MLYNQDRKIFKKEREKEIIMNKQDLINKIAAEQKVTKVRAEEIVNAIFSTVVEELKAGEDVKIPGFGSFVVKMRNQRTAVIPNSNKKIIVPAYRVVGFKPAKSFKEQVK